MAVRSWPRGRSRRHFCGFTVCPGVLAEDPPESGTKQKPEDWHDHPADPNARPLVSIDGRDRAVLDAEPKLSQLGQEIIWETVTRVEII